MDFRKDGNVFIVRLDPGEKIVETLNAFFKKQGINGGGVTGLGSVDWTELGYYNLGRKKFNSKVFSEELELVSLVGTITKLGLHAHVVLSNDKYNCIGGHLVDAKVSGTAEIVVTKTRPVKRKHDEKTGLNTLNLRK